MPQRATPRKLLGGSRSQAASNPSGEQQRQRYQELSALESGLRSTKAKLEQTNQQLEVAMKTIASLEVRLAAVESMSWTPTWAESVAKVLSRCMPSTTAPQHAGDMTFTGDPSSSAVTTTPSKEEGEEEEERQLHAITSSPTASNASCSTSRSSADGPSSSGALRLILMGGPASGKGTQCEIGQCEMLVDAFGLVHLSTGDMLRAAVSTGTASGRAAKGFMERGALVPDEVIIRIVTERLAERDCVENGWLLDGFPRTAPQATALEAAGNVPHMVVKLDVPDDVLIGRVIHRRLDPQTGHIYNLQTAPPESEEITKRLTRRKDDTEETMRTRLANFHENVAKVGQAFPTMVHVEDDGTRGAESIAAEIRAHVEKVLSVAV